MLEIRRSLGNLSASRARQLAPILAARLRETFEVLESTNLSKAECRQLIQDCFRDLAREADQGYVPTTDDPHEIDEQRALAREFVGAIEEQISHHSFTLEVEHRAADALAMRGVHLGRLRSDIALDLISGVARALAEQQRLFLQRLEDRLSNHIPTDPLFQGCEPNRLLPALGPVGSATLSDLHDAYLAEKSTIWTPKTLRTNKAKLQYLLNYLGPHVTADSVTPQQVRAYRDALREMKIDRTGHWRGSVEGRAASQGPAVDPRTAALIFETAKAFFRWAAEDVHIPNNPAKEIAVKKGEKPRTRTRRPFEAKEIAKLFSSPNFTGFKSAKQRFVPGSLRVSDAYYWIPVLGYYSGARLGELVQLHVSDIRLDGPIPYIDINEEGGSSNGSQAKRVKSAAGVRKVPLHPDVMALGFGDFISRRKRDPRARPRLFWEVPFGGDGQASTVFSKWFGRLLTRSDLGDPALVFHSFRHLAQDAYKNASTPQYITDRIIGHADEAVSSRYGSGVSLEVMYAAVKEARFEVRLPEIAALGGAK